MTLFSSMGVTCEKSDFRKDLSVYVCTTYSNEQAEEILHFVAEGGGLLMGGHAWHWAQTHPGQSPMADYAGSLWRRALTVWSDRPVVCATVADKVVQGRFKNGFLHEPCTTVKLE